MEGANPSSISRLLIIVVVFILARTPATDSPLGRGAHNMAHKRLALTHTLMFRFAHEGDHLLLR